ncbi:glycosyltransferase [Phenylobacterium sp. LjRoot225]|uniref:glycosyltransferase n=1 Tax=Phenylobacterium sp. LjRoot225 TaxID=3342285 RepID=UPI003ECE5D42
MRPGLLAPAAAAGAETDLLSLVPDDRDHWLVLAQADALMPHRFHSFVEAQIPSRLDVDIFYGDDVALGEVSLDRRVRLKPAFDITQLVSHDYIGAPLIVRGSAFHRLGGLRPQMGEAALYDLLLRAQALGLGVERIPHVLLAWPGARPEISIADRRRAVQSWLAGRPLEIAPGRTADSLSVRRRFDAYPAVSLIVPTRQSGPEGGKPFVVELLDSLALTDWPMEKLTVLIGDDSADAEVLTPSRWPFAVTRIPTPRLAGEPFNYAAKMNRLWRLAQTEHMVLMNDDVTICSPDWLKALMTFAMDRDVGGVGARLLFPDGRLQHAGVAGGLFDVAAHPWFGAPGAEAGYQDWTLVQREWSMVTGAVFATRRAVMEEVNGFDERFTLEFNDLDLCLRLRLMAYRIVYTPFAELTHREKASRGETLPAGADVALFCNRWRELLDGDPAYHPALARDRMAPSPCEGSDTL